MLGNHNQEHSEYLLYIEAHTLKLSSLEISFVNPQKRNRACLVSEFENCCLKFFGTF